MKIIAPAKACTYLSSLPNFRKLTPQVDIAIIVNIVRTVVKPNAAATKATPAMLCLAAGYMIMGISGSHGPNTKITNKIHGVRLGFFFS